MSLEIANVVEDGSHDEFVEEDDKYESEIDQYQALEVVDSLAACVEGVLNEGWFFWEDEEEDEGDGQQEEGGHNPPYNHPHNPLVIWVVYMLPINLFRLRGIAEFNITFSLWRYVESLSQFFLAHIFESFEDSALFILCPARKYDLFSNALICFLHLDLPVAVPHKFTLLPGQFLFKFLQLLLVFLLIDH
jgi:hypothetical protein